MATPVFSLWQKSPGYIRKDVFSRAVYVHKWPGGNLNSIRKLRLLQTHLVNSGAEWKWMSCLWLFNARITWKQMRSVRREKESTLIFQFSSRFWEVWNARFRVIKISSRDWKMSVLFFRTTDASISGGVRLWCVTWFMRISKWRSRDSVSWTDISLASQGLYFEELGFLKIWKGGEILANWSWATGNSINQNKKVERIWPHNEN